MAHKNSFTIYPRSVKSQVPTVRAKFILPIILLLSLLGLPGISAAATFAQVAPSAIKFSVSPLYDGFYRDGQWAVIEVKIENPSEQLWQGEVRSALAINANAAESSFVRPVMVGAKSTERLLMYLLPTQRPTLPIPVNLYNTQNQTVGQASVRLQLHSNSDFTVGILMDENSPLTFPRLMAIGVRQTAFRLVPYKLIAQNITERQESLDLFNSIIVDDLTPGSLNEEQKKAILAWVSNGGELIFAGTNKLSASLAALMPETLPNLLPAQVSGQQDIDRVLIETYNPDAKINLNAPLNQPVLFNKLVPTKGTLVTARQVEGKEVADSPVIVSKPIGRGSMVVLAVDPFHPSLITSNSLRQWWGLIIDSGLPVLDYSWVNQNLFTQSGLSNALLNMPGPQQPSPYLFILAILGYIGLAVPVSYGVLRRVGRLELGWVVIPGLALVFGGAILWASSLLPVGDIYLSRVNLVQASEDDMPVNVKSFVLVSSANEDQYRMGFSNSTLLIRPQFLASNNPSQNSALPPDLLYQGGNTTVQGAGEGRGRLQVFGAEGWQNLNTTFETHLQIQDDEAIVGTAVNHTNLTIREAMLVYGDNYFPIGDWLPGEEKKINLPLRLKPALVPRPSIDPALFRSPSAVATLTNGTPTPNAAPSPLPTPGATLTFAGADDVNSQLAIVKWMVFNTAYLNGKFTPYFRANNLYLAGWLDDGVATSEVKVEGRRLVQQNLNLFTKTLPFSYVSENGKVNIPPHTMVLERTADNSRSTLGGLNLTSAFMVVQYRLPGEIANPKFQPTQISVRLNSYKDQDRRIIAPNSATRGRWGDPVEAGNLQNNPKVELYNWETDSWEQVSPQGDNRARIDVSRPDLGVFVEPFSGYIRVRLSADTETLFLGQVNIAVKGVLQP